MYMLSSLPPTQAIASTSFRLAPQYREDTDAPLTIPELYDWHLTHNPYHTLFTYHDPHDTNHDTLHAISMEDGVSAMRRAASIMSKRLASSPSSSASKPLLAVLAASDTVTFFCMIVGVLMTGYPIFPISPRNSPAAIAHLLAKTGATHLVIGSEHAFKDLSDAALRSLDDEHRQSIQASEMPCFEDLFVVKSLAIPPQTSPRDSGYSESAFALPAQNDPRFTMPTFDLASPALILHSSGSTAHPKPVTYSHRDLLELSTIPFYGETDITGLTMGCHSMPLSHGMGVLQIAIVASCGVRMSVFKPASPAVLPNPVNVWDGTVATKTDLVCCVPTFIEAWSHDPCKVEYMKQMAGVMYGGGPLNKEVGDALASTGVAVFANYGSTECGVMSTFIPEHPGMDWEYFSLSSHTSPRYKPHSDGIVELIMLAQPTHQPRVTNTTVDESDEPNAYSTNDLLIRHPDPVKKGLFKVYGRADDQIMLCMGEKTNPGPLESILNQDPRIQSAVIFGRGRFHNGVVVDPKKEFVFDISDEDELEDFRNAIWPTVERMNAFAPQHSRLFKEMIMVASPSKPFTYTGKGTARRPAIISAYEQEIDLLYLNFERPTVSRAVSRAASPFRSATPFRAASPGDVLEATRFIRDTVRSVLHEEVADDADLFQHGCDSLQATWIRHSMFQALQYEESAVAEELPHTLIYDYPSIAKLSAFITDATRSRCPTPDLGPNKADATAQKVQEMLDMVEKYSADFPARPTERLASPSKLRSLSKAKGLAKVFRKLRQSVASVTAPPAGDVVLLTGSTGGLGANILCRLLKSKKVARVYAFNRAPAGSSVGTITGNLFARQRAALRQYGLDERVLFSKKCVLLTGDLSADQFGLRRDLYNEIRCTTTHIIHNAWPVNFNISLGSFESNVAGLRALVDLALTSPRPEVPRLLFVSSVGVLRNPSTSGLAPEMLVNDPRVAVGAGYSESKFCAERLLENAARETALRPIVVRPGQLSGGANGYWKEMEWFPAIVKSGQSLQCLPNVEGTVSWVPLDKAASAIFEMRDAQQEVLHLAHPQPVAWSAVVQPIAAELGVPMVPYAEWLSRLEDAGAGLSTREELEAQAQANPALHLREFFRGMKLGPEREPLGVARMDTERAVGVSTTLREKLRPLGEKDARRWVEVWRQRGFLE